MKQYVEETLYLYKILDYMYNNYEIINISYKKEYFNKILTLSNNKLKQIINLLIEGEEQINEKRKNFYYKQKNKGKSINKKNHAIFK